MTKLSSKLASKAATKPASKPSTARRAATPKASAKPAKAAKPDYKLSDIIPDDAFVWRKSDKAFFIASYSTMSRDDGPDINSIMFTTGYVRNDGVLNLTGRSGTIPQELLSDPVNGPKFIEGLAEWLMSFAPDVYNNDAAA